jgi:hypothetical protein
LVLLQACVGSGFPSLPDDVEKLDAGLSLEQIKQISPQTQQRIHEMLRCLFALIEKTDDYYTPSNDRQENSQWKVVKYYRLMRWWCYSRAEKDLFMQYMDQFVSSFLNWNEKEHFPVDENRAEISRFMLHIAREVTQFNSVFLENPKVIGSIVDFFVSLGPAYVSYNQAALVPWYTLELIWARQNKLFMAKLTTNNNFEWAINNLVFGETKYPDVASVIVAIMDICFEVDDFRHNWIAMIFQKHRIEKNPVSALKYKIFLIFCLIICMDYINIQFFFF